MQLFVNILLKYITNINDNRIHLYLQHSTINHCLTEIDEILCKPYFG